MPVEFRSDTALDKNACTMHSACMATKTISLKLEAYERLRSARVTPDESFSRVILRAEWPNSAMSAADFQERCRKVGPHFSEAILNRLEENDRADLPPENKWKTG